MKNLPNIEKSGFRRGEYVGYAGGLVWKIVKSTSSFGNWCAYPAPNKNYAADIAAQRLYAFRLADLSIKLESWKPN